MNRTRIILIISAAYFGAFSCKKASDNVASDISQRQEIVTAYSQIALANYEDIGLKIQILQASVDALIQAPSQATLDAARLAYRNTRIYYELSEGYRFYGGPIDNPVTGREGHINSWPLDESFIDYTRDDSKSGIINNPAKYPVIDINLLDSLNQAAGETSISTGFHAIEFLLWGQDFYADGPGRRSYKDYDHLDSVTSYPTRRSAYLVAVTQLIARDFQAIAQAWKSDASYPRNFNSAGNQDKSLGLILTGIGKFAKGELSGERMTVAYNTRAQEDEQSCFSDLSLEDFKYGQQSISNIFTGKYTRMDNTTISSKSSIESLLKTKDIAIHDKLLRAMDQAKDAIDAIPYPFDQAIQSTEGRVKVEAAIQAIRAEADLIVQTANTLGITIVI